MERLAGREEEEFELDALLNWEPVELLEQIWSGSE